MSAQRLRLEAPDPRVHSDALIDLIAKTFSDESGGYYTLREACRRLYVMHSHYDWQASRVGLLGDRLVTHYGVWKYQMRIGRARVQVGGIGGVATEPEFRRRGYMDQTAQESLEAMRAQGYDLTLLFGIDNFYRRYGYVRAWTDTNYYARAEELPGEAPAGMGRRFRVRPRPDLAELYNAYYARTTGTAVRPTFRRAHRSWLGDTEGYLWGQDGAPAGYVVLARKGHRLRCLEYVGDALQALRVVGRLARKWGCPEVQFATLPHRSELARLLRWNTCRTETHHRRDGGALTRLLNLETSLTKMEGELSERLAASPLAGWRGNLLLAGTAERTTLSIGLGQVKVAPATKTAHTIRGGDEVAQLLLGTEAPVEVMTVGAMKVTGDAARLAEVLFPAQHPQLSQLDRF